MGHYSSFVTWKEVYSILMNQFWPNLKRLLDGCNRACQYKYLMNNPCFVYSKAEVGLFCLHCVHFANIKNPGQFVREKFLNLL